MHSLKINGGYENQATVSRPCVTTSLCALTKTVPEARALCWHGETEQVPVLHCFRFDMDEPPLSADQEGRTDSLWCVRSMELNGPCDAVTAAWLRVRNVPVPGAVVAWRQGYDNCLGTLFPARRPTSLTVF